MNSWHSSLYIRSFMQSYTLICPPNAVFHQVLAESAIGSTSTYSAFLKEQAKKNPPFVSSVEEKIAELVAEVTKNGKKKKSHSFPPMKSHQVREYREWKKRFQIFWRFIAVRK